MQRQGHGIRVKLDGLIDQLTPHRVLQGRSDPLSVPNSVAPCLYEGATHDFDDPGRKRQGVEANAKAYADVVPEALKFFAAQLQAGPPP